MRNRWSGCTLSLFSITAACLLAPALCTCAVASDSGVCLEYPGFSASLSPFTVPAAAYPASAANAFPAESRIERGDSLAQYEGGPRRRGPRREEEPKSFADAKYTLAFGLGGNIPLRDLNGVFNTGTLMKFIIGYSLLHHLQIEGGIGFTAGFLKQEGVVGIDIATGTIVELRGSYLQLPIGLALSKGFRRGASKLSLGGGVLYNRYTESLNLVDYYGLAGRESISRDGFGYYANWAYDHFFSYSGQYGLGAGVRYVRTNTSGDNVGNVLREEGTNVDPHHKGTTSDGWISISVALLYRF
jgi:hypothetical protein